MKAARSLLGIAAGFAVFAVVSGLMGPVTRRTFGVESFESFSMSLLFATLAYSVAGAALGGYFTGLIAGRRELAHAGGLGLLMIGLAFLSMRQHELSQPGWYEATIAGCGPIAALFGAGIRRLTKR